jgi:multisubunit Na+/H+ antiporter MnhG subunit
MNRRLHLLSMTTIGCLLVVLALVAAVLSGSLVVAGLALLLLLFVTASLTADLLWVTADPTDAPGRGPGLDGSDPGPVG